MSDETAYEERLDEARLAARPFNPEELAAQAGLTGVVQPVTQARPFEVTAALVEQSLSSTRQRITDLRAEREQINDEIRALVAEEDKLRRMARIASSREQEGGNGDGGGDGDV